MCSHLAVGGFLYVGLFVYIFSNRNIIHQTLRPFEASELLVSMAEAGAFSGNTRSFFIDPERDEPGLDHLLLNRWVRG